MRLNSSAFSYRGFTLVNNILQRTKSHPLVWKSIATTACVAISRGMGFLIPLLISAWYGASQETDAFFFAYGIVLFMTSVFSTVLESMTVPFVSAVRSNCEGLRTFLGNVLGIGTLGMMGLAVLLILLIMPLTRLITSFSPESIHLIFIIFILSGPLLVLTIWNSVISGTLNSFQKFYLPAFSPALRALVVILIISFLKDRIGVKAIAAGYLFGETLRFLILSLAFRTVVRPPVYLAIRWDPRILEFLRSTSYVVAGIFTFAVNPVIDKSMASWVGEGSISILEYAGRLYLVPVTLFTSSLMVVLLSEWSDRLYGEYPFQLGKETMKAAKVIGLISSVITALMFVFRKPLIQLVFGHGEFPLEKLGEVSETFGCYIVGLPAELVRMTFTRACVVLKRTRIILLNSLLAVILNLLLNFVFLKIFALKGIALSTSVVSGFSMVLIYVYLKRVLR